LNKKLRKLKLDAKQRLFNIRTLQLLTKIEVSSKEEKVTAPYARRAIPEYRSFDDYLIKVNNIKARKDLALREESKNHKKDTFTFLSLLDRSETPFTDYIRMMRKYGNAS
jgi:hypothetical protein